MTTGRRYFALRNVLLLGASVVSAFSPTELFAAGEQGVWYDPSDFSTMFQNAAGTIPVTAVEQPVGLLLDKSKGLTLGSELVPDSGFDSAGSWTAQNADWVVSGSKATYTLSAVSLLYLQSNASISLTASKWYEVRYTVSGIVSGNASFALFDSAATVNLFGSYVTVSANGSYVRRILIASSVSGIRIYAANSGTAASWSLDSFSVRELPGNHARQSTEASRPLLKQDGNGKYYLLFDGTDDSLATGTIDPGSVDKAQVFAGVRKTSDAALAIVAELSATIASNAGSFALTAPNSAAANYNFSSKGTTQTDNTVTTYTSPLTSVLSGIADIAGASNLIRANGAQVGSVLTTQGTGNYLAYPLYIGRRGGTSNPFTGRLYSLILRFGANLTAAQIASAEAYVNSKTGAY